MANILVIDDEESIRSLLCTILDEAGYDVREAVNGRQGLELYRTRSADLIITDLIMPEMNGLDLILELTKQFLNVKVIAMTGEADAEGQLRVAKLLGARQLFAKPFEMHKLLRAVQYELAH